MPALRPLIPALFVFLWSTGFIGARYAMPWAEPFHFLAVRFGIAALCLGFYARATGLSLWPGRRAALLSFVAGILMHGLYLGGVFWAIHRGFPAGFVALIVGLQPLLTAIMAAPVLRERIGLAHWLGLATGLFGVAMVIWPKISFGTGSVTPLLLTVTFLSVIAISAGTVLQKRLPAGSDLIAGTAWQYVGATALTALLAAFTETGTYTLTGELVFALLWSVFVLSLGAIGILMLMIRDGAVSSVSSLFYLVPAVTAAMAWPLFGESLNALQLCGMAITAIGVALASRQDPTRARASR